MGLLVRGVQQLARAVLLLADVFPSATAGATSVTLVAVSEKWPVLQCVQLSQNGRLNLTPHSSVFWWGSWEEPLDSPPLCHATSLTQCLPAREGRSLGI